jgi:hypothetical protein
MRSHPFAGFLLATLAASFQVAAAPQFWTLNAVRLSDGAIATGSFSYDDATQTIATWNLRVSDGPSFLGFSYVPGNSVAYTMNSPPGLGRTLVFESPSGGGVVQGEHGERALRITPLAPLDGNSPTRALTANDHSGGIEYRAASFRLITTGSLVLTFLPAAVAVVQIDEFFNATLQHYFITADSNEKTDLDAGVHAGWSRTGQSFKAYAAGSSAGSRINPVCRYNGQLSSSHFHSGSAAECFAVHVHHPFDWIYESDNVFQIDLPDTATGACPVGTIPVFRLWNQRADSNHRYTTTAAIKAQMLAAGYLAEGYGADGVVMCAIR